ncbi:hypothetical protein HYQ46_004583 [Verticillium longisporum]|nr:hypothetical protein HYQ46_004583 [Verticillium longisporum]
MTDSAREMKAIIRVELLVGPVKLGIGAAAVALVVGRAVAPERNVVDVVEAEGLGGDVVRQSVANSALNIGSVLASDNVDLGQHIARENIGCNVPKVGGVDLELCRVHAEHVQVLVGDTAKTGDEEEDEGCRGQYKRQSHAEKATDTHS